MLVRAVQVDAGRDSGKASIFPLCRCNYPSGYHTAVFQFEQFPDPFRYLILAVGNVNNGCVLAAQERFEDSQESPAMFKIQSVAGLIQQQKIGRFHESTRQ